MGIHQRISRQRFKAVDRKMGQLKSVVNTFHKLAAKVTSKATFKELPHFTMSVKTFFGAWMSLETSAMKHSIGKNVQIGRQIHDERRKRDEFIMFRNNALT